MHLQNFLGEAPGSPNKGGPSSPRGPDKALHDSPPENPAVTKLDSVTNESSLAPRGVMLLAGKSVINLAKFLSVIFASEENQIPVMLY